VDRVKAFESPLWAHLDEIRQLRKTRWKWKDIARHFSEAYQIQRTPSAIYRFFKRATSKRLPAGFYGNTTLLAPPSTTQTALGNGHSAIPQGKETPSDLFEPLPIVERNPWLA
jgi:hypothetical protein